MRPGKYIEYEFPLLEVNRLAVKEANSKKPIYTMHKWWARRLSCVFRTVLLATGIDWEDWDRLEPWRRDKEGMFINGEGKPILDESKYHQRVRDTSPSREWHEKTNGLLERAPSAWERLYYRLDDEANAVIENAFKGKTILDPFMGGGTTIVEALRLGANAVGCDLNPVAWFVVKKETDGCDMDALEKGFKQVEAEVAEEIKSYYKTECPCCGKQADVMYSFWVKLAKCPDARCGKEVPLFNSYVIAKKKRAKKAENDVPRNKSGKAGMDIVEGKGPETRFIVCANAACGHIYASTEKGASSKCPQCGHKFDADTGQAYKGKFTCECSAGGSVLDAAKLMGKLDYRLFGLELYCPECDYKGYRKPEKADHELYERAVNQFEAEKETLNFPTQDIPPGYNTYVGNPLPQHGFHKWSDMFNPRQLLLICKLRDAILKVRDQNVREYLLLAWSAAIEYCSLFVSYQAGSGKTRGTFSTHAFVPNLTPTEGNLWGADYGRNTFKNQVVLIKTGIKWLKAGTENFWQGGENYGRVSHSLASSSQSPIASLLCQSSEDLSSLSGIAAHCLTDPPYYGNVMYAELADFFHVWLRTALAQSYPEQFGSLYTPKDEEVVETVTRGHGVPFLTKDEEFFTSGLTRIFTEVSNHLDDNGLLAFTFHHQANEAWGSVLKTVLDAGFFVRAVYPVHAEMLTSLHLMDKANIAYDAVIVCKKVLDQPKRAEWFEILNRIHLKAEKLVRELESHKAGNGTAVHLPPEDVYVIVVGKCLEEYSKHYYRGEPFVFHNGRPVTIAEALDGSSERELSGIGEIVDNLVEDAEGRTWPIGLDAFTRFYVVNLLGQTEVPYDRIKRRLMNHRNLSVPDLERVKLIRMVGSKAKVLSPLEREDYLEAQIEREEGRTDVLPGMEDDRPNLLQIDKLHWLCLLDERGAAVGRWASSFAGDTEFVALVKRIADNLESGHRQHDVMQRIVGYLSRTGGLF